MRLLKGTAWYLVWLLLVPVMLLAWAEARINARRCPRCQVRWHTHLIGEWGDEHWFCSDCGHGWFYNPGAK